MKTGRTLQELAQELHRQITSRKDYVAPQERIRAVVVLVGDTPVVELDGFNGDSYGITPFAHRQFADHLGIPQKYYDRMLTEQPALLAENLNVWLRSNGAESRMFRTLDRKVRAFLSPKYRPLDNFELAQAIIPVLLERKVQILSAELTETRMYIKGILPDLSDDLPAGAVWGQGHTRIADYAGNTPGKLVAAVTIANSEVGAGTLSIIPSVFTTWCTNLAQITAAAMKKYHVGRSADVLDDFTIYTDATRAADDKAFWLKVKDVTAAAFDPQVFAEGVRQIREASEVRIESRNLQAVVETAVRQLALPEKTESGILNFLAQGGDLTKWGLSSAITAAANDAVTYELATDLERAGGKVLALPARDWDRISNADGE